MRSFKNEKGQSMVEFALVLPILLLIVCGILDFGWLFFNQLSVNNVAREAARYAVVNSDAANLQSTLEGKVQSVVGGEAGDDFEVLISFSNPGSRTSGDVTVTVNSDMAILTPVLGTINGSMTRTLTASVVMKVES